MIMKFWRRYEDDAIQRNLLQFSLENPDILPAELMDEFVMKIEHLDDVTVTSGKNLMYKLMKKYGEIRGYFDYVGGMKTLFSEAAAAVMKEKKTQKKKPEDGLAKLNRKFLKTITTIIQLKHKVKNCGL